jgi:hypothetical protein
MKNEKSTKLQEAVESPDLAVAAQAIVEVLLDDEVSVTDIAADFIEDEVGHYDWINNWNVVRSRTDPVQMVQEYLDRYGLVADAQAVVNVIDGMAKNNPGRWK